MIFIISAVILKCLNGSNIQTRFECHTSFYGTCSNGIQIAVGYNQATHIAYILDIEYEFAMLCVAIGYNIMNPTKFFFGMFFIEFVEKICRMQPNLSRCFVIFRLFFNAVYLFLYIYICDIYLLCSEFFDIQNDMTSKSRRIKLELQRVFYVTVIIYIEDFVVSIV